MMTELSVLLIENVFSAWLFANSSSLGICLVLAWAAWRIAAKYTNFENRFSRIDSELTGLKASHKAMGKRMGRMEDRMGRMEGQLNIIIAMLKRDKAAAGDLESTRQTHLTPHR